MGFTLGALVLLALSTPKTALALDKQGSAHGGATEGDTQGFDVSGALSYGISIYNKSYAARPDNTGLVLFRYAGHADVDLIGRKLSIPVDVNMFSDRKRGGLAAAAPTEFDVITGLTTTWDLAAGSAIELGSRVEHDRQVGASRPEQADDPTTVCGQRGLCNQTYVDARARFLYSLAHVFPSLGEALGEGDVSGAATLGWFAYNPTYAARPDNTDHALLRYGLRTELSVLHDYVSFGVDNTFFTARETSAIRPSELDLTLDLIGHFAPWELHVAYERDMPIDRGGLTQSFIYLLGVWNFDIHGRSETPLQERGGISSP